tara:strand:- start:312 stop:533 length:222 start_codon:yes stop_codon:yes gene_type:complete
MTTNAEIGRLILDVKEVAQEQLLNLLISELYTKGETSREDVAAVSKKINQLLDGHFDTVISHTIPALEEAAIK